ncbi:uncharacterized protein LOC122263884 [Penaeus japonicus]|uniref:uncharacterized protein LOC122263884 n=1 Tax=Penaeus japonicus TaxID=27405 RepID=UPI001C716FB0|nr:uncharacterized protein LOC122263884 [Penaeus japonicus]
MQVPRPLAAAGSWRWPLRGPTSLAKGRPPPTGQESSISCSSLWPTSPSHRSYRSWPPRTMSPPTWIASLKRENAADWAKLSKPSSKTILKVKRARSAPIRMRRITCTWLDKLKCDHLAGGQGGRPWTTSASTSSPSTTWARRAESPGRLVISSQEIAPPINSIQRTKVLSILQK